MDFALKHWKSGWAEGFTHEGSFMLWWLQLTWRAMGKGDDFTVFPWPFLSIVSIKVYNVFFVAACTRVRKNDPGQDETVSVGACSNNLFLSNVYSQAVKAKSFLKQIPCERTHTTLDCAALLWTSEPIVSERRRERIFWRWNVLGLMKGFFDCAEMLIVAY